MLDPIPSPHQCWGTELGSRQEAAQPLSHIAWQETSKEGFGVRSEALGELLHVAHCSPSHPFCPGLFSCWTEG